MTVVNMKFHGGGCVRVAYCSPFWAAEEVRHILSPLLSECITSVFKGMRFKLPISDSYPDIVYE